MNKEKINDMAEKVYFQFLSNPNKEICFVGMIIEEDEGYVYPFEGVDKIPISKVKIIDRKNVYMGNFGLIKVRK